jgi:ribosomal protein S13
MNVFISGSINISKLPNSAIKKIENIISKNFTVLVGDAKGVDLQVQKYLSMKKYNNVIVYFAGKKVRGNVGKWETKEVSNDDGKKGRELYTLKDIAMAKDADYGLMIWDGLSHGTLNNIKEMKNRNKRFYVVLDEMIIDEKNIDAIINTQNK